MSKKDKHNMRVVVVLASTIQHYYMQPHQLIPPTFHAKSPPFLDDNNSTSSTTSSTTSDYQLHNKKAPRDAVREEAPFLLLQQIIWNPSPPKPSSNKS